MIRYVSPPGVSVEIERNGHVTWEKYRNVLEVDDDHVARFYRQVVDVEPGGRAGDPTVLTGSVTHLVPGHRMSVRVQRDDTAKGLTFELVAGRGELIGEFRSDFTDGRYGIILAPEVDGALFPPPLGDPLPATPPATDATPPPTRVGPTVPTAEPTCAGPIMTLEPGAPVSSDDFRRAWARLNRHLRRHGGRDAGLKLAALTEEQRRFLEALFSGPLDALEHDALDDLRDYFADDPRPRLSVNITSLTLPDGPERTDRPWQIVLGESRWGGVVIVYDLSGWTVTDRVLVG